MSKVFRRPMFRGGSTNMNGIMSGIQDRKNYADGPENPSVDSSGFKKILEEIRPVIKESLPAYEKPTGFEDPIYQLGIQTGLDLMSKADSQNLIRNIASAAGRQTPQLFKSLAEERGRKRKYEEGVESASVGLAGDILGREISASGKNRRDPIEDLKFETEFKRYAELGLPSNVTERAANFVVREADEVISTVGSKRYGGVLDFNVSDRQEYESNKKRLIELGKENKIVYDPFENNYKRITMVGGQPQFDEAKSATELMQIPLPTIGEPEQTDRSVPDFGMSIDDPSA
tara:strand:+ start:953 stop:1816 length:864 start_codon:yes stop_codon:yes gene_type:complete